jgi:prepilin-type processing-associated H-X9-DG protein
MREHRMWIACGSVLTVVVGLCIGVSIGQGQKDKSPAPETLLPAGSLIYVGWDGSEAHQEAWEQTAAYEALHKTGLADLIKKVFVIAVRESGGRETDFLKIFNTISQKGLSVSVSLPDQPGPSLPRAVVVLHEGKPLEPLLSGFLTKAVGNEMKFATVTLGKRNITRAVIPNTPGIEVGWWAEGEHLVFAFGAGVVDTAIAVADGKSANITTDPLWKNYREQKTDFEMSTVVWLDFGSLREKFGAFPLEGSDPNTGPLTVNSIIKQLGLNKTGAIVYRSGYRGRAQFSQTVLESPAPHRGLLALSDQPPMTLKDLPPLPVGISGFHARSIDWSKTYAQIFSTIEDVLKLGPPKFTAQFQEMKDQLPALLGFDLYRELLDPLGNVLCLYGDAQNGFMGFGGGIAIQVDDPKTLRKTIEKLLAQLAVKFDNVIQIRSVQKHDREMIVFEFDQFPFGPALSIDDNWFIIGLSSQTVETFLLRLDDKLAGWKPTAEHQQALSMLPEKFTSITITDPRNTIRSLLGFVPMAIGGLQAARIAMGRVSRDNPSKMQIRATDIPPAELVTNPLFPNVTVATVDKQGLYWTSRTSLPSIPLIAGIGGGGGGVAVSATLVALLLPAVQSARAAARRTQSKNNLKQIGLALHNYHDTHKSFPQGTHPNKDLEVEKRLSWIADILPFLDQAALHNQIEFNKAWDDAANHNFMQLRIQTLQNPGIPDTGSKHAVTHYVGLAGLGKEGPTLPVTHKRAGMFGFNRVTRMRDIRDGTSNSIAVSEAGKNFGPWGQGGKSTIRPLTKKPYINGPDGIGGPSPGGCNMLFGDGSVRFISQNIDPDLLERLTTINGGEVVGGF